VVEPKVVPRSRTQLDLVVALFQFCSRLLFLTLLHFTNSHMAEEKLRGKMPLINGNSMHISVNFNRMEEPFFVQVDCGSSYTQTSTALAVHMGLKSHRSLLGRSAIGNGQQKVDYLCPTLVSLLGVEAPLVVKVAPDQLSLLGLDAMFMFDMELFIMKGEFSVARKALSARDVQFQFLDMGAILKKLGIPYSELVPVESLPPPDESYKELVHTGKSNCVLDLGTTFGSTTILFPRVSDIVDLGCSH